MKIAVVILNWNGKKLLQQFLPSIVMHSHEADLYVVDNASTDDSVSFVATHYPSIQIIQNSGNFGYAKGYNEALKQIDADVYCLLNSDVEVTPNWLDPVVKTFKQELNTAIIQPKLLDYHNKEYFEYAGAAGGFIDRYAYPYCRGRVFDTIEKDQAQYSDHAPIFWASGACFFIRKQVFNELKGFDKDFFAHFEEIDLCWRAFNAGYDAKYIGTSVVFHVGGATLKNTNPKKTYLNFRNSLYTITKNAHGNLFIILLTRLILDGIAGGRFLFQFKLLHILSILRAHLDFYIHLPLMLKRRKKSVHNKMYYTTKSIVWSYFIDKRRTFNG